MTPLIKRLEALTGPSREVDAEIAKAIGWVKYITWTSPNGRIYADCPNFTNSLDAAMTLVPKMDRPNFPWLMMKSNNPNNPIGCRCELWLDNVKNYRGRGATLAVALCIAALKAREVEDAD